MIVTLGLINGLVFGIEHMSPDEDEDYSWIVIVHIAVLRFCFIKS